VGNISRLSLLRNYDKCSGEELQMSWNGIRYSGRNIEEAKEKARLDNERLEREGSDARILISTMKWNRSVGRRGPKGTRYYTADHIGNLEQ